MFVPCELRAATLFFVNSLPFESRADHLAVWQWRWETACVPLPGRPYQPSSSTVAGNGIDIPIYPINTDVWKATIWSYLFEPPPLLEPEAGKSTQGRSMVLGSLSHPSDFLTTFHMT